MKKKAPLPFLKAEYTQLAGGLLVCVPHGRGHILLWDMCLLMSKGIGKSMELF